MKQRIKDFQKIWKSDYYFSTVFSSAISTLISIVFALYNGALGIVYESLWHGLICVYYLLLATIRAILIGTRRKNQKTIRMITSLLLLVMDVSLIGPIYVMVSGERSYTYGLIPTIAMAAYTTYRITITQKRNRYKRSGRTMDIPSYELHSSRARIIALFGLVVTGYRQS